MLAARTKVVAVILVEAFVMQLTSEQTLTMLLMSQFRLVSTQFHNNSFGLGLSDRGEGGNMVRIKQWKWILKYSSLVITAAFLILD